MTMLATPSLSAGDTHLKFRRFIVSRVDVLVGRKERQGRIIVDPQRGDGSLWISGFGGAFELVAIE